MLSDNRDVHVRSKMGCEGTVSREILSSSVERGYVAEGKSQTPLKSPKRSP